MAIQNVAASHETPNKFESDPAMLGKLWTDQFVPFHTSASASMGWPFALLDVAPTATQKVGLVHEGADKAE
jgi:hypothetical protein